MKLKVISYTDDGWHICHDERGKRRVVDLCVDKRLEIPPEELVGREVEVDHLFPCRELALGVRILNECGGGQVGQ